MYQCELNMSNPKLPAPFLDFNEKFDIDVVWLTKRENELPDLISCEKERNALLMRAVTVLEQETELHNLHRENLKLESKVLTLSAKVNISNHEPKTQKKENDPPVGIASDSGHYHEFDASVSCLSDPYHPPAGIDDHPDHRFTDQRLNPLNESGEIMRCLCCESFMHMKDECPYKCEVIDAKALEMNFNSITEQCDAPPMHDQQTKIKENNMATFEIPTPSFFNGQNFDNYKKEIKLWETITSVDVERRGAHLLQNLPSTDKDPLGVKDKILEKIDITQFNATDGVDKFITEMGLFLEQDENEEEVENIVLFTKNQNEREILMKESANKGVLDSGCSAVVSGNVWLNDYVKMLPNSLKNQVTRVDSKKRFQFGGEYILKSEGKFSIPAVIMGRKCIIQTDVVNSDIPLILSKQCLQKMRAKIDYETNEAIIFGKYTVLNETTAGHHTVDISPVNHANSARSKPNISTSAQPRKTRKIVETISPPVSGITSESNASNLNQENLPQRRSLRVFNQKHMNKGENIYDEVTPALMSVELSPRPRYKMPCGPSAGRIPAGSYQSAFSRFPLRQ